MNEVLSALLQGIIQGLTEFLPISSSGHLSLFQFFFKSSGEGSLFFSLMLHLGTLAAVIAAFYQDVWNIIKEIGFIIRDIFTGNFRFKTDNPNRKMVFMLVLATLPMILVLPVRGFISGIAEDKDIVAEGFFFLITAGLLFLGCKAPRGRGKIKSMRPRQAVTIGVVQAFAAFPGISRSGSTISTGLFLGFDRAFMVKFSFLLGIPAILGGAVAEIGDVIKEESTVKLWPLFLGMLAAAVFGYLSIMLVRKLLLSDKFIIFAWYALILGVIVIITGIVCHIIGFEGIVTTAAGGGASTAAVSGSAVSQAMAAALF